MASPNPSRTMPPPNGHENIVIHAADASKEFQNEFAVRDLTLDIPQGRIFGFIGPSGSGKTTTIRLLTGLLKPTSGEVLVLGKAPHKFRTGIRQRIGYMPQLFALYPELTVWENLNFCASLYGMGLFRGKRLHQVLNFVELDEHRGKLARNISGGMQRRLSLAATLVHNPELIFLDEPTAGIDPILRNKFWEHFRALRDNGHTLFVTTQYVVEAAYCDLVGIMSEGRLLVVDTPDNLRRRAFGGDVIEVKTQERISYDQVQLLKQLPGIRPTIMRLGDRELRLTADDAGTAMPDIVEWARARKIEVTSIEPYLPPFDDVFVELVQKAQENDEFTPSTPQAQSSTGKV